MVSGDTSTLEDYYFKAPTNGDNLGHKHRPRPPKSDFTEPIPKQQQQQQQQQQHRGLNQVCHKTTSKMLKNKRIT